MTFRVFFSWQSDIPSARVLIEQALDEAVAALSRESPVTIDRDTRGVPGAPEISSTILEKIDGADSFVADLTIINAGHGPRAMPNPNVLVELGYAIKSLGLGRVVLVQDTAHGGPESLPFDVRGKRVATYAPGANSEDARRKLVSELTEAIGTVIAKGVARPSVTLALNYKDLKITPEHHSYRLAAVLKNVGTRRVSDWTMEVEFPTRLLDGTRHAMLVPERSDRNRSFFRLESSTLGKPLYPNDEQPIVLGYYVDTTIFQEREQVFAQLAEARAYVDGHLVATTSKRIDELQNF
jgi:hypothetical protein